MRYGRHFSLPIDPWPQASLAERTAVGMVLTFLLFLPACAALFVASTLAAHVYWSYDLGASVRAFVARRAGAMGGQLGRPVRKV
ncbi:hypothetical protein ACLBX9_20985 [Methylobacterium sp. A49B]|uniref:Uncharacterized protein n=1 Tax=Methylobacterium mesophilicum SR1.6/6 TaxID=908290 RepID=A0A6B9FNR9_9HYPH|nr:hypothetical protein [Methylobacterium mesophilicum]QGY04027.1 hypothetical protein MMSR116_20575 [Methylobacterium mesophilicum SR1.6/6]